MGKINAGIPTPRPAKLVRRMALVETDAEAQEIEEAYWDSVDANIATRIEEKHRGTSRHAE
jgi:hypothetical protein